MDGLGRQPSYLLRRGTAREVLEAILETYTAAHRKARAGEKTPQHLRHVPTILQWFPNAKVLCMLRNRRDASRSLRSMPWYRGGAVGAFLLWQRSYRLMRKFEVAYPGRFLVVRYEELAETPADVLTQVMAFLGETFEPSQLDTAVPSGVVLPRSMEWKSRALGPIEPPRRVR